MTEARSVPLARVAAVWWPLGKAVLWIQTCRTPGFGPILTEGSWKSWGSKAREIDQLRLNVLRIVIRTDSVLGFNHVFTV